jgi:DNA-directed RNA polymerase subunit alpha
LYLKKLRFKILSDESQIVVDYSFNKADKIYGKDLSNDSVEVVNPEAYLCTINSDVELKFSIILQKAIGYTPSEDTRDIIPTDFIPMDAFFSPVREVVYNIEKILVEDNPNFEKVVFDVKTDGQITPVEAFGKAINVMYDQMSVFNKVFDIKQAVAVEPQSQEIDLNELIQRIDSLNLSARSFNSIDRAGIKYLGELVLMSEVEVKNIKNLGKKSFDEISEKLKSLKYPIGVSLPEDIASALRKKLEQIKG